MAEINSFRPVPQEPAPEASAAPSLASTGLVCNAIIAINVIVYIIMGIGGAGWFEPDSSTLLKWGADLWPLTTSGQQWRLLTAAFLHFGLIHLLANMYALMSVGWLMERLFGSGFFGVLYLLSAITSSAVSIWWDREAVCAGASGAVFAVYGGVFGYLLVHRSAFPKEVVTALFKSTAIFVGYNVIYGLSQKGISNSAHLSGLASGFVMGALFARPLDPIRRAAQTKPRMLLAGVCAALICGAVMAIPNSGYDFAGEKAFLAAESLVRADEKKAVAAYKEMVKQKLDNPLFAAGLDEKVIPIWDSMVARLEGVSLGSQSPSRMLRDAWLAYAQEEAKASRLFSIYLKNPDDAGLARYKAQLRRSEEAEKQLVEVLEAK